MEERADIFFSDFLEECGGKYLLPTSLFHLACDDYFVLAISHMEKHHAVWKMC